MKAKFVAFAMLLSMCTIVKGAEAPSVPRNILVASDNQVTIYLHEGVPCTEKKVLEMLLPSEADSFQIGRILIDGHSYEMCWQMEDEDVWMLIAMKDQVHIAHANAAAFHKAEGI